MAVTYAGSDDSGAGHVSPGETPSILTWRCVFRRCDKVGRRGGRQTKCGDKVFLLVVFQDPSPRSGAVRDQSLAIQVLSSSRPRTVTFIRSLHGPCCSPAQDPANVAGGALDRCCRVRGRNQGTLVFACGQESPDL